MHKLELNVGDTVTIVCNEPDDVSEATVVAEVENHYIVKCGKDLHNFTLEGKNTSNPRMYLRIDKPVSTCRLRKGLEVYSKAYGKGIVVDHDTNDNTYRVEFADNKDALQWYSFNGMLAPGINDSNTNLIELPDSLRFMPGEVVEVRDTDREEWVVRIFESYNPHSSLPYVTSNTVWAQCRKFNKDEYIKKMLTK